MEAKKSQDLQLSSWRLRKANSVVPVHIGRPENQESQWDRFQFKIQQAQIQEEPMCRFKSEGRESSMSQFKAIGQKELPLSLRRVSQPSSSKFSTDCMRPIPWGRAICFTHPLIQVLISFQNIFTNPE